MKGVSEVIHTINHIGIGLEDIDKSYQFYKELLRLGLKISDKTYRIWELEPMFNRQPLMRILNVLCKNGGPSFEMFQHIDTTPRVKKSRHPYESIGFCEIGVEVKGLKAIHRTWKRNTVKYISEIQELMTLQNEKWQYIYLESADGIVFQLYEKCQTNDNEQWSKQENHRNKQERVTIIGMNYIGVCVSDMKKAKTFYMEVLGFDEVVFQERNTLTLYDGGKTEVNQDVILLSRNKGSTSKLSGYNGGGIKLICSNNPSIEQDMEEELVHRFGDVGITEIGFEVDDVAVTYNQLVNKGAKALVPPTKFHVRFGPKGTLAYVADPDGNVLELVQVKSICGVSPVLLDKLFIKPTRRRKA